MPFIGSDALFTPIKSNHIPSSVKQNPSFFVISITFDKKNSYFLCRTKGNRIILGLAHRSRNYAMIYYKEQVLRFSFYSVSKEKY